jgi:amino acid adenylation domain-containing protein
MVAGMLAALAAGGAYVPLDPAYPQERLAFLMADSGVTAILAQRQLAGRLPPAPGVRLLLLDEETPPVPPAPAPPPGWGGGHGGDTLANVIYTSGSTGRPKGVAVPHRAVLRLVLGADYLQVVPGMRLAQCATATFDAATFEVWAALLNGGTLVIVPRAQAMSPVALAATIRRFGIRAMFLTSALFHQAAHEIPDAFAPLDTLLAGGEAMDPSAAREVLRHGPPRRLINIYGPTENTGFSTWHLMAEVAPDALAVPIGLPIANSRAVVLDAHLRPVPVGVHGSLYVGGDGLAWGYLGRPRLTAQRFIPDPFSAEVGAAPGGRLYATGDIVRRVAGGAIEFIGRADQQVKIRGYRIELGEIEAALRAHPAVVEAVVEARREPAGTRLAAYLVAAAGAGATAVGPAAQAPAGELRDYLKGKLPDYMVPAAYVWLPELPLTANGKVDRQALPEPAAATPAAAGAARAAATPLEQLLAAIFSQVFKRPGITGDDDFFVLGGHSLLATQVVARVERELGIELEVRSLFEEPTIAGLARRIQATLLAAASGGEQRLDELPPPAPADAAAAAGAPGGAQPGAPRTPLEELMAGLWAEELRQERVGIHDSFWDLGGDPRLAARLLARLGAALGVDLAPETLVEAPTIVMLTAVIGDRLLAEEASGGAALDLQ